MNFLPTSGTKLYVGVNLNPLTSIIIGNSSFTFWAPLPILSSHDASSGIVNVNPPIIPGCS